MQLFNGTITNSTEAEALNAMQWVQTNYGADTQSATYNSGDKNILFQVKKNTFSETVAMVQAFKAQFSSRLINYKFIYRANG